MNAFIQSVLSTVWKEFVIIITTLMLESVTLNVLH